MSTNRLGNSVDAAKRIGLCAKSPFPNMQDRAYRAKIAQRVAEAQAQRGKMAILPECVSSATAPAASLQNDPHREGNSSGPGRTLTQPVKKNTQQTARNRGDSVPNASPKPKAKAQSTSMKKKT